MLNGRHIRPDQHSLDLLGHQPPKHTCHYVMNCAITYKVVSIGQQASIYLDVIFQGFFTLVLAQIGGTSRSYIATLAIGSFQGHATYIAFLMIFIEKTVLVQTQSEK
ncbi:uncharacterized protein V1513DRAFT_453197 [Lipomyces chichibuensis]|uniref:uncharacterized protein n=1 Tax=Lipomyces chichibuensis TaxID=1546026 RepID=UPI0033439CE9